MFATIETNGATHIAIYIPHEGADKTLPALAAMLEQNATFIAKGYQSVAIVKPAMNILLGDEFRTEDYGIETVLTIPDRAATLGPDFKAATPEAFTSNAKAVKQRDDELSKLRTELSYTKQQLETAQQQLRVAQDRVTELSAIPAD